MPLPEDVPDVALGSITDILWIPDASGFTISPANVKIVQASLIVNKNGIGNGNGFYQYISQDNMEGGADLVYANGDVTITGEFTHTYSDSKTGSIKYNLTLKKGWNLTYGIEIGYDNTFTTQKPNADMAWTYGH
jgi:hypothetical protein